MQLIQYMLEGLKVLLYMIQKIKAMFGGATKNYDEIIDNLFTKTTTTKPADPLG